MDRGELFNSRLRIVPCEDGSFIVEGYDRNIRDDDFTRARYLWGFSSVDDLMEFLTDHADGMKARAAGAKDCPELKKV